MASRPISAREPLNRERVLRAALDLADREGIEALSMRKLGTVLGVEAMSLYHHVTNKAEILDGIVDLVVGEFEMPDDEGAWHDRVRRGASSALAVLVRHPWACGITLARQGGTGLAQTRHAEWLLGTLRRAGFSVTLTHHAFHVIETYVYGYAAANVGFPFTAAELPEVVASFLRDVAVADHPFLVEHATHHVEIGPDGGGSFEFGLDLILDGLERRRDAPGRAR